MQRKLINAPFFYIVLGTLCYETAFVYKRKKSWLEFEILAHFIYVGVKVYYRLFHLLTLHCMQNIY